jgi:choline dehydrogenase-like flavoprotein
MGYDKAWYDHAHKNRLGQPGIVIHIMLLRPKSKGSVMLSSGSAYDSPLIDTNYLSHPGTRIGITKYYNTGSRTTCNQHMPDFG